jgi:multifunctional 2-oxoglutarate metabolism enzyme
LVASKTKDKRDDVAVLRIKPLAPLFERLLSKALDQYPSVKGFFGVQEEPGNQGA